MSKTVFYSFHYDNDAWRVQQIAKMGAVEGQSILNAQDWEAVQKKGKAAIETWIDEQMAYKKAVVVLIGSGTAARPWVQYEIQKAWNAKKPLVGVRIHGLANSAGNIDSIGPNPFERVTFQSGGSLADHVPVFNPSGSNSKDVYASIAANIATWADNAYKRL